MEKNPPFLLWGRLVESGSANGGRVGIDPFRSFSTLLRSRPVFVTPSTPSFPSNRSDRGRRVAVMSMAGGKQMSEYNPEIWINDATRVVLARLLIRDAEGKRKRERERGRWKNLMKLLDEQTGGLLACLRSLESGIGFAHWIRYFRSGQRDRYSSHVVNIPRPRPCARSGIESRQA